jgi:putative transcriptional regulator
VTKRAPESDNRVLDEMMEMAAALDAHDLITKQDMTRLKALGREKPPLYTAEKVVSLRTRQAKMSQFVFASILNVSVSTVQKWESSVSGKHPSGAAAKLLQLIEMKGVEALLL